MPGDSGTTIFRPSRTEGQILLVANEFLDALPVRQLVKTAARLARTDGCDLEGNGENDASCASPATSLWTPPCPRRRREAPEWTLIETSPAAASVVYEVAGRLAVQGGAALLIDYGHDQLRTGSTLQAMRAHRSRRLRPPGRGRPTAHVDFATLAPIAQSRGARCLGTVPQGTWLRALGIESRADALSSSPRTTARR